MNRRFTTALLFIIALGLIFSPTVYAVGNGDGNLLRRTNQGDDTCGGPTNACHNLQVHNATNTGSTYWSSNWGNTTTSKYGKFICQTCHTPHNTQNIYLIREKIKFPDGSTMPSLLTESAVDFRYKSGTPGSAPYAMGDDSDNHTTSTRPCEVCHSQTLHHRYNTSAQTDGKGHNNALDCNQCHKHEQGFKKGGEGGAACNGCHTFQWNAMNGSDTSKYYMYLTNTDHLAYPNQSVFGSGDTTSTNRKCTMCHARMEEFSPKVDFTNTVDNRAKNLRRSINITPDGSPNTVSDTDFIASDVPGDGGICTSCHKNSQYKANTATVAGGAAQTNADSTTYTPQILPTLFVNSPHNYEVPSAAFIDGNSFRANCLKCHNEYPSSGAESKMIGSGNKFAPHASTIRRLNAPMTLTLDYGTATSVAANTLTDTNKTTWTTDQWKGRPVTIVSAATGSGQTRIISANNTTGQITVSSNWTTTPTGTIKYSIGDPAEEEFCFNCHSTTRNPNYASKKDYYGVKTVQNGKMFKMEDMFRTYTGTGGAGNNADTTNCPSATYPTSTSLVISPSPAWTTGQWAGYAIRITGGTGAGQIRKIAGSGASFLCLDKDWTTAPVAASTYEIGQIRHRIDAYAGVHRADEAVNAPTGITTAGWFASASGGTHSGCTDCHNPHAQKKSGEDYGTATSGAATTITDTNKAWTQDQWRGYNLRLMDGTGAGQDRMIVTNNNTTLTIGAGFDTTPASGTYYVIVPTGRPGLGNNLSGPNNGQWGVDVAPADYPTPIVDSYSNPTFTKNTSLVSNSDKIYELCFKCHSDYGWGNNGTPFNIVDATSATLNVYQTTASTNIAREFNPHNVGYHPVVDIGANQPIMAMGNGTPTTYATGTGSWVTDNTPMTILTDTTKAWQSNQWAGGYCVQMTSGAVNGWLRAISANTATTLTVDPSFDTTTAPDGSATYAITKCSIFNNGTSYSAEGAVSWPRFTRGTITLTAGQSTATIDLGVSSNGIPSTVIPGWYLYAGALNTATEEPNTEANVLNQCSGTAPCPPMFATSGWFQVTGISAGASASGTQSVTLNISPAATVGYSSGAYALTAGLGNNFIPPYGPWSVIACTDCHDTDNSQDPSGPHGSANPWILKNLERQRFQWYTGGVGGTATNPATPSTAIITVGYPDGAGTWTGASGNMPNYFCLNCHRSDIYGYEDNSPTATASQTWGAQFENFSWRLLSRVPHTPDGDGRPVNSDTAAIGNTYGIMCMNCHGGDARSFTTNTTTSQPVNQALGGIHGSNVGKNAGAPSYRGRRLLNGAMWTGVERATTFSPVYCYTKNTAGDGIASCAGGHTGDRSTGRLANYPYYSGQD